MTIAVLNFGFSEVWNLFRISDLENSNLNRSDRGEEPAVFSESTQGERPVRGEGQGEGVSRPREWDRPWVARTYAARCLAPRRGLVEVDFQILRRATGRDDIEFLVPIQ